VGAAAHDLRGFDGCVSVQLSSAVGDDLSAPFPKCTVPYSEYVSLSSRPISYHYCCTGWKDKHWKNQINGFVCCMGVCMQSFVTSS
jgi:hypothetical protein